MVYSLIINSYTDKQHLYLAYLPNETHITANDIHMIIGAIYPGYVATIIFYKIHSSNEFITPHSTAHNVLNVKA